MFESCRDRHYFNDLLNREERAATFLLRFCSGLSSTLNRLSLRFCWRLKDQDDVSSSTSRTHEPALQTCEREVAPARPDKRMKIQLLPINARSRVRAIIDDAPRATRRHAPAVREGVAKGLDFHT
jgi:hypothetical protein